MTSPDLDQRPKFTCPGLNMPQPTNAPPEGYVACYRAGHECTSTCTETTTDDGGLERWVHCPCCGETWSVMYVHADHLAEWNAS